MTFKWLLTFKMSFKPKKQWQILNVCFLIFPMIYNMSVNEKVDFLSFFKYELQNGFKMTLKPKNNYIFLKHKLSAFQWYITCHDIRKLILCHFLMYELQNGFKMSSKLKNNYRSLKHRLWAFKWYIICIGMKKLIFWCTSFKNGSKSGLVVQRVQKSVKNRFSNRFPIVCVLGGWWLIFRMCVSFLDGW